MEVKAATAVRGSGSEQHTHWKGALEDKVGLVEETIQTEGHNEAVSKNCTLPSAAKTGTEALLLQSLI